MIKDIIEKLTRTSSLTFLFLTAIIPLIAYSIVTEDKEAELALTNSPLWLNGYFLPIFILFNISVGILAVIVASSNIDKER